MKVAELIKKLQGMNPEEEVAAEKLFESDLFDDDVFAGMSDEDFERSGYDNQDRQMYDTIRGFRKNKMFKTGSMSFDGPEVADKRQHGIYATDMNASDIKKAKIIAKVKYVRDDDRSGSVDDVDMSHYQEYKKWYDEHPEEIRKVFGKVDDEYNEYEDKNEFEEEEITESKLKEMEDKFNESLKTDFEKELEEIANL